MPVSRRAVTGLAALLLVLSSLAACAADGPLTVTASDTQELDVAVGATTPDLVIRVEMFNGPIEVRAGDAGRVAATVETTGVGGSKAEAEADRAKIQVTLDANPDGSVLLRAVYQPNPGSPNDRAASAVVDVPPDAALDLQTSNGTVTTSRDQRAHRRPDLERRGRPGGPGVRGERADDERARWRSTAPGSSTSRPRMAGCRSAGRTPR